VSETSEIAIPNKILIVRLGAMGDVLHALPAAMYLKSAFPNAQIGWVVEKRWSPLLEWRFHQHAFPDVVHKVDTRGWRKNLWASSGEIARSVRELRGEKYDVAIDFQGAMKSAMIALLGGAPRRFGFANPWEKAASLFYTNPVRTRSAHVVKQNRELAAELAGDLSAENVTGSFFQWSPSDPSVHEWLNAEIMRLRLQGGFIILNPGAGWGAKQWPVEHYAELARELGAYGVRSLINHGPGEEELAAHVEQNSDGHAVAASFTISQLMAITRKASLFIGGDTGPMHLAALLNVPVVALFGPTDPARNGPYATKSIVLRDPSSTTSHKRVRETDAGLRNITVAQVLKAVRELVGAKPEGVRA
jgi:heptosyltransferase I